MAPWRVGGLLEMLDAYLRIPSREGFSAYRTGWIGHLAFSALAAASFYGVASTGLGLALVPSLTVGIAAVILLWGVGVLVGVYSHYIPLLMIAAFLVVVGSVVLSSLGNHVMLLGLVMAAAGHALMTPVAFLLKLLRNVLR